MSIPLIPWYVPYEESVLSIAMKIHEWLDKRPDDIYALVVMNLNKCVAMSIVYIDNDEAVFWQAQSLKGYSHGRFVLEGMKHWARSRGAKALFTIGNSDRVKKLHKRYGFIECEGRMGMSL